MFQPRLTTGVQYQKESQSLRKWHHMIENPRELYKLFHLVVLELQWSPSFWSRWRTSAGSAASTGGVRGSVSKRCSRLNNEHTKLKHKIVASCKGNPCHSRNNVGLASHITKYIMQNMQISRLYKLENNINYTAHWWDSRVIKNHQGESNQDKGRQEESKEIQWESRGGKLSQGKSRWTNKIKMEVELQRAMGPKALRRLRHS